MYLFLFTVCASKPKFKYILIRFSQNFYTYYLTDQNGNLGNIYLKCTLETLCFCRIHSQPANKMIKKSFQE